MVRLVPRGREIREDPRQEAHAQGRLRRRGEARADAARRDPRRGEGARRGRRQAQRLRQEAVRARQAHDVRLLVHQGPGLRVRRRVHARGHDRPREAQDVRAGTPRQEPGPGHQEPRRSDFDDQPLQRAPARVVRDALPGTGRLRPRQEVRRTGRPLRRQGRRHGGAGDRHRIHRRRHGR